MFSQSLPVLPAAASAAWPRGKQGVEELFTSQLNHHKVVVICIYNSVEVATNNSLEVTNTNSLDVTSKEAFSPPRKLATNTSLQATTLIQGKSR